MDLPRSYVVRPTGALKKVLRFRTAPRRSFSNRQTATMNQILGGYSRPWTSFYVTISLDGYEIDDYPRFLHLS